MRGKYDILLMSVLFFALAMVFLTRKYDDVFRRNRLKLKRRKQKRILAIKQYGLLALVGIAIAGVIMLILKRFVLD